MTMYLVDARLRRWAYDLDRGSKRNCRLYDSLTLRWSGSTRPYIHRAHATVPVNASSLLPARIWTPDGPADSMLPVPADCAGGLRLR